MKYPLTTIGLGSGKVSQFSISEVVDQKAIEEFLLKNINIIEDYIKNIKDDYVRIIQLTIKTKLNFIKQVFKLLLRIIKNFQKY